ncbi:MAG: RNA-binding transcriptional accessory protein [Candidatus Marinimicrobia bacterium]|nr:RNA-binding transcriptional accessory protein [Candidatus Neomarinimicrobiota bacterium]MCF7827732.1 RNA-binding transcriptional accessory protein [Candidatus Neomarinimicrobiota bacterium]MCF7881213.1 RNA-binding transcriptional accessory protein [Candidatus Neomarinimicrobiota bacterium]
MSDQKSSIPAKILNWLTEDLKYRRGQMKSALELLAGGATIPFVARYRKEATGELDEIELKEIWNAYQYYDELEERKETVLATIEKQDKLTDELKARILECREKTELEDLYAPYKPKRRTRAQKAREKGLEPLADSIWLQPVNGDPLADLALEYLSDEVESVEDALAGAHDILAERIADDPDIRQWLREYMYQNGLLVTKAKKEWRGKQSKFEQYYDYSEPVKKVAGHRFLAIRRGADEDIINYSIDVEPEPVFEYIAREVLTEDSPYKEFLQEVIEDAYGRLLSLSISSSILSEVREESEEEAIDVFAKNVRDLLMAAPAGHKRTMAIDPGFRTGCKIAVLNETGQFLENETIYPHPPQEKRKEAAQIIKFLAEKYDIELIAIGNGTAGRETEAFTKEVVREQNLPAIPVMVNESGASVYSASEVASEEFPDLDLTVRGAISIGRRLQDPLAELVKIDPKSIGVGQYQHDVNQTKLKEELDTVISSCVNAVGVDINTASKQLLTHVSGLTTSTAENIVDQRESNGKFKSREEIKDVPGIGAVTFEQCAGFLKIPGGKNPLDNSNVHPESYYIVEKMAKDVGKSLGAIVGKGIDVDPKKYVDDEKGLPTVKDILTELRRPGRDPRDEFKTAEFKEGVEEIGDLKEGMLLEGTVTNVTHFGAFVDVGVHQDGLVHISEIADKFVDDPHEEVKVGQVVKVKVLSVDEERNRIGLSMKQAKN